MGSEMCIRDRVNVGNVNRKAVYGAVSDFLSGSHEKCVSWAKYFGRDKA